MEQLFKSQDDVGKEIQRMIRNYKKDSDDRKTTRYLSARLEQLDEYWKKFSATHELVLPQQQTTPDHHYFTNDYFNSIQKIYQDLRNDLTNRLEMHQEKSKAGTSSETEEVTDRKGPKFTIDNLSDIQDSEPVFSTSSDEVRRLVRLQKEKMASLARHLQDVTDKMKKPLSKPYCEHKLKTIEEYWKRVTQIHDQIIEEFEKDKRDDYDAAYFDEMETWVGESVVLLNTKLSENNSTDVVAKLPKIKLPTFDGNYLRWKPFRDLYIQLVHQRQLSASEKMYYLSTSLIGEAKTLIQHIPVTGDNYESAWEILENRYNNERLLANTLINRLLNQPTIHQESSAMLKQLHDTSKECVMGLANLGLEVDKWDPIIIHVIVKKLDKTTHNLYEQSLKNPKDLQSVDELLQFLELRFQALETLSIKERTAAKITRERSSCVTSSPGRCLVCSNTHPLYICRRFLELSPKARLNLLIKSKRCINCMRDGHSASTCTLRGCTKCANKHNTLVHISSDTSKKGTDSETQPATSTLSASSTAVSQYVLLSTALVHVLDKHQRTVKCRAILDSGSQVNLITERLCKRLGLPFYHDSLQIKGIGETNQRAQRRVNITVTSRYNNHTMQLDAYTLPKIITQQPTQYIDISLWKIPKNIRLADPDFNAPTHIDLLIGAEFYYQLLSIGQIALGRNLPVLQNTILGWTIGGKIVNQRSNEVSCASASLEIVQIQNQLENFWRLEEGPQMNSQLSEAERKCEELVLQTLTKNPEGRFVLRLPFLHSPTELGQSKDMAYRRFLALERRLSKNKELKSQYTSFLKEYEDLGHMKQIHHEQIPSSHYFLPHHCVLKPDSTTTKLRVVFDASAKTTKNVSLNDILCTGPTIQDELFTHLLRFRLPKWVFTSDIEKMYRQILIADEDMVYQLIMWREDPSKPIRYYALRTVTYGTTTAPYLATKCLYVLAEQHKETHPLGAKVLRTNFYMDDVMTGSNDLKTAVEIQSQLRDLLMKSKFKLRKWCANHPKLLANIPPEDRETSLEITDDTRVKTLGLLWLPQQDQFAIKISTGNSNKVSKRIALSDIAHIFDPLGLTSPVIIRAKIFIQELWRLNLDWDASLPMELHTQWLRYREELKHLEHLRVPRHVFPHAKVLQTQIHVFSDASEKAYGAAAYIRSITEEGQVAVKLLCAKSRVAPTKTISLPRLELCAAKLASELAQRVQKDLEISNEATFYWTDSEIVLCWIRAEAAQYQTFVANRISAIQNVSQSYQWRHVNTKENPADVLSRGISPSKLSSCQIWFQGPPFLQASQDNWPIQKIDAHNNEMEKKRTKAVLLSGVSFSILASIDHKNSYNHLLRILAYVLRFIQGCRKSTVIPRESHQLTVKELAEAEIYVLKEIQQEAFLEDKRNLDKGVPVSKTSEIASLTPFIDDKGLIRVGGRLGRTSLPYDTKHPILLPHSSIISKLLLQKLHIEHMHVGAQALLAITRQRFWPVRGRKLAASIIHRCIRCCRSNPKTFGQIMGDLPNTRTEVVRPFTNTGVDFCGPVLTHFKIRGKHPQKSYIAVFCCFSTKAIHLELVTDLTTEGFIGALRRFIGRRGLSHKIYCDNGSNFIGASNQLKELQEELDKSTSREKIMSVTAAKGIEFHFIPPRAPHFGGLWEAAVKSTKGLLHKALGAVSLTYEELETALVEVEAVLNSRPLTPMSSDPNDLAALTPGHFLIGEPLASITEPDPTNQKPSLLKRWKLVSYVKHEFWRRWSLEYLCELQQRYKWKQKCKNAEPGMLVLLKEDNLPPLKWSLGRIVSTIPGPDNQVRVVDVRTANGILRRPVHKLCPLPMEDKTDEELQPNTTKLVKKPERCLKQKSRNNKVKINPINPNWLNAEQRTSIPPDANVTSSNRRRKLSESAPAPQTIKSSRLATFTLTTLLLLTSLVLPVKSSSLERQIKLGNDKWVYFENLGTANLISDEWNLIIYYKMQPYWNEINLIQEDVNQLEELCRLSEDHNLCKIIIDQFNHQVQDVIRKNEFIKQGNRQFRQRRSPFDIVGNIAHSLFGILDNNYAAEMSNTIKDIQTNENRLLELAKNQTSIIDSTINIIKDDQESTHHQLRRFEEKLTQLDLLTHQQERKQLFTLLSSHLTLLLIKHLKTQEAILATITSTHHGKINPLLLRPEQFSSELQRIKTHLPARLTLPSGYDGLLNIYDLLTIEGRITNDYAIFRVKLPLAINEHFEVLRVIPLPRLINGTIMNVKTNIDTIIINLHRDQYYLPQPIHGSSCITPGQLTHLCKLNGPIRRVNFNEPTCVVRILQQLPIQSHCKFESGMTRNSWIQLYTPNEWIYVFPIEEALHVVCGNNVEEVTLHGTGLVKLKVNCTIKQQETIIHSFTVYKENKQISYLPSVNFTGIKVHEINSVTDSEKFPWMNFSDVIKDIQKLKDNENLPIHLHPHEIHQFAVSYSGLLLIIIVIMLIVIWILKRRFTTQSARRLPPGTSPPFTIELQESINS